jgi:uncharacterized protein
MLKTLLLGLLRFYQLYLSPLKGPTCRFVPTCSQYTLEAISHYGPMKGLVMGAGRLLRCHPFHAGGYDPVIKNHYHCQH